ncbi:MAG: hypothetical protein WC713_10080 [Candidatus Methylomirabilota bacterium]
MTNLYLFREKGSEIKIDKPKDFDYFVYLFKNDTFNYFNFVPADKGVNGIVESIINDCRVGRVKSLDLEIVNGNPAEEEWISNRNNYLIYFMNQRIKNEDREKLSEKEFKKFIARFEKCKEEYIAYCEKMAKERPDNDEESQII